MSEQGSNPVAAYREELPRAAQWGTLAYVYTIMSDISNMSL